MRATVLELRGDPEPLAAAATVRLTPCWIARLLGARVELVGLVATERWSDGEVRWRSATTGRDLREPHHHRVRLRVRLGPLRQQLQVPARHRDHPGRVALAPPRRPRRAGTPASSSRPRARGLLQGEPAARGLPPVVGRGAGELVRHAPPRTTADRPGVTP